MTLRKAASKFDIPKSTLHENVKGKAKGGKPGPPPLLTKEEEQVLVNYIHISERRAMPVTVERIFDTVEAILTEEAQKGIKRRRPPGCIEGKFRPSKKWWTLFRKRNPTITIRTPENLSQARKSVTKQSVVQWFASAKEYFTENNLESVLLDPSR